MLWEWSACKLLRREVKRDQILERYSSGDDALFIKIQFQNPLHTKDEKFCRNGWALARARRFLFFALFLCWRCPSCLCFCSIWILCRCEKVPRERRAAILFAQQLSPPRRAIFQALPLAQKQSAKNRNFLFHYLLYFFSGAQLSPRERTTR